MYPRIDITYEDLNSTVLYHRFVAETQLGGESADVLWSSAMDQQAALVDSGYTMTYDSPEKANFPEWASWKNQAFATTYEPIVVAYNKKLMPAGEVPADTCRPGPASEQRPNALQGKGGQLRY
ncbi:extracellular solute-binding protein [Cupriavidus basilensis]